MKKAIKWISIILGTLLLVATIACFYLKSKFVKLGTRKLEAQVTAIPIPSDSASLERGKLLAVGCRECHGHDYSGKDFFNDPAIGYMSSPNLTPAQGSAVENYTDLDWVRTLRHAINPKGRPLMVMPSEAIGLLGDQDLGCLIAYMKSIKPIEKPMGPTQFTFMANILAGAGLFGNLYPYDIIKHDAVRSITAPAKAATKEYGFYFTQFHGCATCHGEQFNGFKSPDPVSPPGSNITTGGNFGKWNLDDFKNTLRSGKTPEGKILDAKFMPWPGIGVHEDVELEALYLYLKSLPALPNSPTLEKALKKQKGT